jgi:hypothetical protein
MTTTDLAITVLGANDLAIIGAGWSLAMWRGWRITAPVWRKQNAAPAAVGASGEVANPAAAGAVPIRDASGRFAERKTEAERAS